MFASWVIWIKHGKLDSEQTLCALFFVAAQEKETMVISETSGETRHIFNHSGVAAPHQALGGPKCNSASKTKSYLFLKCKSAFMFRGIWKRCTVHEISIFWSSDHCNHNIQNQKYFIFSKLFFFFFWFLYFSVLGDITITAKYLLIKRWETGSQISQWATIVNKYWLCTSMLSESNKTVADCPEGFVLSQTASSSSGS